MVNRNGSNNGHSNGTGNGLVHVNGNGHDAALDAAHHELLWDGLPPAVTNALGQPLDPPRWSPSARAAPGATTTTWKGTSSSTRPTASSALAGGDTSWREVRRVTRHRIPDSIGRNSKEVSGSTDLPRSESLGGKQHVGKAVTV